MKWAPSAAGCCCDSLGRRADLGRAAVVQTAGLSGSSLDCLFPGPCRLRGQGERVRRIRVLERRFVTQVRNSCIVAADFAGARVADAHTHLIRIQNLKTRIRYMHGGLTREKAEPARRHGETAGDMHSPTPEVEAVISGKHPPDGRVRQRAILYYPQSPDRLVPLVLLGNAGRPRSERTIKFGGYGWT